MSRRTGRERRGRKQRINVLEEKEKEAHPSAGAPQTIGSRGVVSPLGTWSLAAMMTSVPRISLMSKSWMVCGVGCCVS